MPRVGFVFSGEGAKGAIQAGIALRLYETGVKPHYLTGVSSGAVNAILFPYLGPDANAMFWRSIGSITDLFDYNWQFLWTGGLFKHGPMRKKLAEMYADGHKNVQAEFPMLDIQSGNVIWVQHDDKDAQEYLHAAVSVPGLVTPVAGVYVDAASRVLAPLKRAINNGCDEIYVILGKNYEFETEEVNANRFLSIGVIAYRGLDLLMHEIMRRDINLCLDRNRQKGYKHIKITLVHPKETPYGALEFDRCSDGVDYGYGNFTVIQMS